MGVSFENDFRHDLIEFRLVIAKWKKANRDE